MDVCRSPAGTNSEFPASGSCLLPGMRTLSALPLFFILAAVCVNTAAVVAKESKNTCEEIKILQGIPDATVFMGKIFYYPVPVFAFWGTTAQYKVTLASGANLPKWLDFNPNTSTLQGLPMTGESGVYLLNVVASGRTCTLRATLKFTIHVQDSILLPDTEEHLNHMPNSYDTNPDSCGKEVPITSAEIILSTGVETLEAQECLYIVCTIAKYLHLDFSLVTLLQYTDVAHSSLQSLTVLAEDTAHIDFVVNHYVGLSWPVKCGEFAAIHKFIQVLQHNVDSRHLSQLLGYEITGWRILRRGGYQRKSPRWQHRQLMITPTPTLKAIRISQRTAMGDDPSPLFSAVPSHLLVQVVSPTQSLLSLYEEQIIIASYKDIHLVSQENLVTLNMDSIQDIPANPTVSIIFSDTNSPFFLSPSLVTKTFLFTELEVLPTVPSGMSLQQPQPHVPQTDSYFHFSKSEVSRIHLLQDITSNTDPFSKPKYTLMINTLHEWPHTSEAFPSKTAFHVFLPEATSTSEVPYYNDEAKSHFPKSEMLFNAFPSPGILLSLSPNTSLTATNPSDFTSPVNDTFPPSPASSRLSHRIVHGYEHLSMSSRSIPQPSGLLFTEEKSTVFPVIQPEAEILYPKLNFHPETSACLSITLYSTFPGKAERSYEPSLSLLSCPNSTLVLTPPVDFSSFDVSKLPTPTNIHSYYGDSMLKTQMQSAVILSTTELHSGRNLETRMVLSNVTASCTKSQMSHLMPQKYLS